MVSYTRLNTNRVNHSIRQFFTTNALSHYVSNKIKPIAIIIIVSIISIQLVLLNHKSGSSIKSKISSVKDSYKTYTNDFKLYDTENDNKIVVVDDTFHISTHYRHLLSTYSEDFPKKSLDEKCKTYFDELYKLNHDWEIIDPEKDHEANYNKDAFDRQGFFRTKIQQFKDENDNAEPSEGKLAEIELAFQHIYKGTMDSEQAMIDAVTHLRVFGKCYLREEHKSFASSIFDTLSSTYKEKTSADKGTIDLCYDIEQRLFPWLSRELPQFTRWDGQQIRHIPKMSNYIDEIYFNQDVGLDLTPETFKDISETENFESEKPDKTSESTELNFNVDNDEWFGDDKKLIKRAPSKKNCFLDNWRSSLNGKGIVLSVADKYESDIIGLIRVLRGLNNRLPIQLVHKGDLSDNAMKNIVKVAREDNPKVPLSLYEKIKFDIPHNFPKQEVWFVNAKRCIKKEYQGHFVGYANKLIAYLFNSFDDTLLMDTDTIPLVKPHAFFETGPYKRTNTIFFKDRFLFERISTHDSVFFKRLMPTLVDESIFGIPKVGNLTLENRYIKHQYKHVMEAGVVGIKRSTHFLGTLTAIQLNFWGATNTRIWGDKELFWLGQSVAGNENYEFNKHDVVAVGELTPMSERPKNTIAHELCSTHPGHLSGDDDFTLLWINSGARYCKIDGTAEEDFKNDERFKSFSDAKSLDIFYHNPVKINAALVPPGGDRYAPNDRNEPAFGWVMTGSCGQYLWCAYDIIGGSVDPLDRGAYVEYDNVTEYRNEYLGRLWLEQNLVDITKYDLEVIKFQKDQEIEEKKAAKAAAKAAAEAEAAEAEEAKGESEDQGPNPDDVIV
ncbi:hypothetical protein WICMUC_003106 [Wickerhamomyces mucosus]|uniref:Alpha-1,3-mannosyltransferase n=1 Tax=Wickerhamomyces mucosus TaxID=1378264 RepID=A0A9P8TDN8_9ASCO|nr:hypothetical protein WICMUC_003106 [Wickerhamomyces mucosus]